MLAPVMDNMRADVRYLDAEHVRNDIPVTHEEMADNFSKFCLSPDVQNLVSGEHLYNDFVEQHRIILLLQVGRRYKGRPLHKSVQHQEHKNLVQIFDISTLEAGGDFAPTLHDTDSIQSI